MKRFDIYLTDLNPTIGREIKKIRPAVIISSDDLNDCTGTVIIAPMTTKIRKWPTRVLVNFSGKEGQVVLEQIKSVDKSRLKKKLGHLQEFTAHQVLQKLKEMFS